MLPTSSLPAVFTFSFLVGFFAVVSPGPVTTAIVSQAPRQGWRVGPLIATGHSLTELVIVVLIAFGLASGLAHPGIQTTIALLGGLLLLWMGAGMVVNARRGRLKMPGISGSEERMTTGQMLALGVVTTISNPFWYAWWVTFAAGYLVQAQSLGLAAVIAFYTGHISADYAWDTFLASVMAGGKRLISDRIYRWLILICGIFLAYLGGVFLYQGLRQIFQTV